MAKIGRPKGAKQNTEKTFVRYTGDEKDLFERAIEKRIADIPGAKLTIASFLVACGVSEAKRILGRD